MPVRVDKQPIPLKDFMDFKRMTSGNEVLINLDNADNLRNGELIGGLIELGRRDKANEHEWNAHPIVLKSIAELKIRLPRMNAKNVIQTPIFLQNLRIVDPEVWQLASRHALRLLHKYKGRDMAMLLDLYDRDILDEDGEPHLLRKAEADFFERVVGILPMQIKHLSKDHLIRTLEVVVRKGLGSERLYRDYLMLKIERNLSKLSIEHYCRMIRALADKQYVEDSTFWNEYAFKYIHEAKAGVPRAYTVAEAHKVWDALIYLKLKCPSLDVKNHIGHVE
jgi:hypothetical protein